MNARKTGSEGKTAGKSPVDFDAGVKRILTEPAYARKLHALVERARDGDKEAAKQFQEEFFVSQKTLDRLHIRKSEKEFNSRGRCTFLTPHFMVDFAVAMKRSAK
ncbi:MAG: hypothetical protein M3O82_07495 [Verrucomicrobiota bacterium]|nr:hypothetical protein [Verrucomicrobiota bacterium]